MTDRNNYEAAKANAATAQAAKDALREVRERMLDLVIAGKLGSKDFEAINALEQQLDELYDRLNSDAAFGDPTAFASLNYTDLVEIWGGAE